MTTTASIGERLAKVEVQVVSLHQFRSRDNADIQKLFDLLREHMEAEEEERKQIRTALIEIQKMQSGRDGLIKGVVLTVSAVWAVFTLATAVTVAVLF